MAVGGGPIIARRGLRALLQDGAAEPCAGSAQSCAPRAVWRPPSIAQVPTLGEVESSPRAGTALAPVRTVRRPVVLLIACFAGVLPARSQDGLRLAERVPSPLAYLSVATGEDQGLGLDALRQDPAIALLWSSLVDDATSAAIGQLGELSKLAAGEVEFTLNALMPRAGAPDLPLLVARVQLSEAGATSLSEALTSGELGGRCEDVAGRPTWLLGDGARAQRFQIALAGRDLLASNSRVALEDVLRGAVPGATSTVHPESVAANATFAAQRAMLGIAARGHVLHVDWRRLRDRIVRRFDDVQSIALDALGLASAAHLTIAMRSGDDATHTTLLADQPDGPDGLLAAALSAPPRRILANLPPLSLAGLTISVDPARLRELMRAGAEVTGTRFAHGLVERCNACGVDMVAQVLPRLGGSGSAQLVLLDDEAREQGVAFSVGARSGAAARMLLGEIRDNFTARSERGPGAEHDHDRPTRITMRGDRELLTFEGSFGEASLGVVGKDIVFAPRRETIERMSELTRRGSRERARTRAHTQDICDRIVTSRPPAARNAVGVVEIDGSLVGKAVGDTGRHAGLLFLDAGTLRIELVSPR